MEWSPLTQGFDEYFGVLHSNDMTPLELYRQEQMIEDPVNQNTLTERYTNPRRFDLSKTTKTSPFFLYMPHTFPHVPLYVSNQFSGQSDAGLYGDVVETIDWSVGEVLATLRKAGPGREYDRYLSPRTTGRGSREVSGPYRDRKGSSWEGGQRVPFIAKWVWHDSRRAGIKRAGNEYRHLPNAGEARRRRLCRTDRADRRQGHLADADRWRELAT